MIFIELFFVFFKIGLFCFGGYAIIAMLQNELITRGWITIEEFSDIVSISQITPGSLGLNASIYIGYNAYGIFGAITAALGTVLPSFILIILTAGVLRKYYNHKITQYILRGIRPVTLGFICSAVFTFTFIGLSFDIKSILFTAFIICLSAVLSLRTKINSVIILLVCALIAVFVF